MVLDPLLKHIKTNDWNYEVIETNYKKNNYYCNGRYISLGATKVDDDVDDAPSWDARADQVRRGDSRIVTVDRW